MHARSTLPLLALVGAAAFASASAFADPPETPPVRRPVAPPAADPPFEGAIPEGDIPPGSLVWHPWRLFDPYLSPRESVVTGALFHDRAMGTDAEHSGFSLAGGPSIESHLGVLFVRAQVQYGFRLVGGKEFAAELAQFSYAAGFAAGPLELYGRAGFTVADVYLGKGGFGLGFLSPRVGGGASVKLGHLRIGVLATSELAWRWTGGPSETIHSLVLDIGIGSGPKGLPPFYRIGSESRGEVE